jgi:hypothetical protein
MDIAKVKPGYFQTKERTEKRKEKLLFSEQKTKYKIVDDSLYILNSFLKWDAS